MDYKEGGGVVRKLVLIIIAFMALVAFIRAFDTADHPLTGSRGAAEFSETY
jgi:hypothetical protein